MRVQWLEDFDLIAFLQGDDGLLHPGLVAHTATAASGHLALDIHDIHPGDSHPEGAFDRFANCVFGAVGIDLEGVLPEFGGGAVRLLTDKATGRAMKGARHFFGPEGKRIDLVIDGGPVPGEPSSVISLIDDVPEIIRVGKGEVSDFE